LDESCGGVNKKENCYEGQDSEAGEEGSCEEEARR
jgi:hypothetical protein